MRHSVLQQQLWLAGAESVYLSPSEQHRRGMHELGVGWASTMKTIAARQFTFSSAITRLEYYRSAAAAAAAM